MPFQPRSYRPGKRPFVFGLFMALMGVSVVGVAIVTRPMALAGDQFATATACPSAMPATGNCYATLPAVMVGNSAPGVCGRGCHRVLTFRLADGTTVAEEFGHLNPPVGIQVQVTIWKNALISFTYGDQAFHSLSYPMGSAMTSILDGLGLLCVLLGAPFIVVGLLRMRRSPPQQLASPTYMPSVSTAPGDPGARLDALLTSIEERPPSSAAEIDDAAAEIAQLNAEIKRRLP